MRAFTDQNGAAVASPRTVLVRDDQCCDHACDAYWKGVRVTRLSGDPMSRRNSLLENRSTETPTARFLRFATRCRARDLKQLYVLGDLAKSISELTHALQK